MKYIKSILEFAQLRHQMKKMTGDKKIDSYINRNFFLNDKLLDKIYIKKYKKTLKLYYFHNKDHNIIDKIKIRTSFMSILDFNNFLKLIIIDFFENHLKEIFKTSMLLRYGLYLPKYNISIILEIDYSL